jgi:peptidoglycan/xylan/chitin deacetylase (PgdA/CDA1 family)
MKKQPFLAISILILVASLVGCPSVSTNPTVVVEPNVEKTSQPSPTVIQTPAVQKTTKVLADIAIGDRHLWPETVNTPTAFDKASRAAILEYALSLQAQKSSEIRSLNRPSVKKWLDKELTLALRNYQMAAKNCAADDWTCLGELKNIDDFLSKARALQIPAALRAWQESIGLFARTYIGEQARLASKFPNTTSEIDLFNDNEWTGDDFPDRVFFLTFDDGPTAAGGNTDGVLEMLAAQKKTAVFFVLGKSFESRRNRTNNAAMAWLYQGQCVASHGWEHLSHQKGSKYAMGTAWQSSVTGTEALLKSTFGNNNNYLPLFRPPYGQRKAESGAFFQQHGLQVALWNLDSQDWNNLIEPEDIINRMMILMLIKRHGVLLFHDVHPKAKKALPVLIEELGNAVTWKDCQQLGK